MKPLVFGSASSVRSIESEFRRLPHVEDQEWVESNRLLLASWATLARMPWAAAFVREGRLPDFYLGLPRGLAKDAIGLGPQVQSTSSTEHGEHLVDPLFPPIASLIRTPDNDFENRPYGFPL